MSIGKKIFKLLVVVVVIYLPLLFVPSQKVEDRKILEGSQFRIAHRCGRNIFPENTLYACTKTKEEGIADFLEFDFHLTKDNIAVVIHDSTLERTTNGIGEIKDKNWEEIKDLDAGYYFTQDGGNTFPYRGKGVRLHKLENFLEELKDQKLMIEVKPDSEKAIEILFALVDKFGLKDSVILGSFHQSLKDKMVELRPELTYFASKTEVTIWVLLEKIGLSHLYKLPSHTLALPPQMSVLVLDKKLIAKAHSQNLKIHVWTINSKDEILHWEKEGVDGVMTDNPRLFY